MYISDYFFKGGHFYDRTNHLDVIFFLAGFFHCSGEYCARDGQTRRISVPMLSAKQEF